MSASETESKGACARVWKSRQNLHSRGDPVKSSPLAAGFRCLSLKPKAALTTQGGLTSRDTPPHTAHGRTPPHTPPFPPLSDPSSPLLASLPGEQTEQSSPRGGGGIATPPSRIRYGESSCSCVAGGGGWGTFSWVAPAPPWNAPAALRMPSRGDLRDLTRAPLSRVPGSI